MPEFLKLHSPVEALHLFLAAIPGEAPRGTERLPTEDSLGRVLAAPVRAIQPLPQFRRSTVDGYAVRAADTYGASFSLPAYLRIAGQVRMGAAAQNPMGAAQAVIVHTGGMIPQDADAVVMLEDTQRVSQEEIEVLKPAAVGQHILEVGEDVKGGETVLEAGCSLRPQEIGGLMALGVTQVEVARKPRVGILSTGDEVVPPGTEPGPGQVRDVNSYTLSALVTRAGGQPVMRGIIPDDFEALREAARAAHGEDDLVVITAGSSVSTRDLTERVISSLGDPGVLVHGIAIKPGKPTILAVAGSVPLIGLPGNPVSALVVAGLFVSPLIRRLLGLHGPELEPTLTAALASNIASETGREDYLPVHLDRTPQGWIARPVFGRSNLIFTLVRAHGLVRIPPPVTGLAAGEIVEVKLF